MTPGQPPSWEDGLGSPGVRRSEVKPRSAGSYDHLADERVLG